MYNWGVTAANMSSGVTPLRSWRAFAWVQCLGGCKWALDGAGRQCLTAVRAGVVTAARMHSESLRTSRLCNS